MKNIKYYFAIIFISLQMNLYAQNSKSKGHYNYQVREEEGDLNNDGMADRVTVKMDTVNEMRSFQVQIFLSQPNGKSALAVSSDQMIEPQYPIENNGEFNGYQIPDFFIEKGILSM